MGIKTADCDLDHLYPPFRAKLLRVLDEVAAALGEPWRIVEGYRSPERQTWLYAQGRTRPGRIVTWMRSPKWHGTGLAADCIPSRRGYGAPMRWWLRFRAIYQAHGLENPAWGNGDLGHVQLTDPVLRAQALVWVRAGFPREAAPLPTPEVRVIVDGQLVADAGAYLEEGRLWVKLRPVTDALDLVIAEVQGKGVERTCTVVDDQRHYPVPVLLKDGHAFTRAIQIPARLTWDGPTKTARLEALE